MAKQRGIKLVFVHIAEEYGKRKVIEVKPKDYPMYAVDWEDGGSQEITSHLCARVKGEFMPVELALRDDEGIVETVVRKTPSGAEETGYDPVRVKKRENQIVYFVPSQSDADIDDESYKVAGVEELWVTFDDGKRESMRLLVEPKGISGEEYRMMLDDLFKLHQELLVDEDAGTHEMGKSESLDQFIDDFLHVFEQIERHPEMDLVQGTERMSVRKVKHITGRSRMESAVLHKPKVNGISYQDSPDIYEHRIIKQFMQSLASYGEISKDVTHYKTGELVGRLKAEVDADQRKFLDSYKKYKDSNNAAFFSADQVRDFEKYKAYENEKKRIFDQLAIEKENQMTWLASQSDGTAYEGPDYVDVSFKFKLVDCERLNFYYDEKDDKKVLYVKTEWNNSRPTAITRDGVGSNYYVRNSLADQEREYDTAGYDLKLGAIVEADSLRSLCGLVHALSICREGDYTIEGRAKKISANPAYGPCFETTNGKYQRCAFYFAKVKCIKSDSIVIYSSEEEEELSPASLKEVWTKYEPAWQSWQWDHSSYIGRYDMEREFRFDSDIQKVRFLEKKEKELSRLNKEGRRKTPAEERLQDKLDKSTLLNDVQVKKEQPEILHQTNLFRENHLYRKAYQLMLGHKKVFETIDYQADQWTMVGRIWDIYQRWCCVKILMIFVRDYGFSFRWTNEDASEDSWENIRQFVAYALKTEGTLSNQIFHLWSNALNVDIELYYDRKGMILGEKTEDHYTKEHGFRESLRPDFLFKIKACRSNTNIVKNICMDAKYRGGSLKMWHRDLFETALQKYLIELQDGTYEEEEGPLSIAGSFILQSHSFNRYDWRRYRPRAAECENMSEYTAYCGNQVYERFKDYIRDEGINLVYELEEDEIPDSLSAMAVKWAGSDLENIISGDDQRIGSVCFMPGNDIYFRCLIRMIMEHFMGSYRQVCWLCGSRDLNIEQDKTAGGYAKYHITCNECGEFWVETHCSKCHRKLAKHRQDYYERSKEKWMVYCPRCGTGGYIDPDGGLL